MSSSADFSYEDFLEAVRRGLCRPEDWPAVGVETITDLRAGFTHCVHWLRRQHLFTVSVGPKEGQIARTVTFADDHIPCRAGGCPVTARQRRLLRQVVLQAGDLVASQVDQFSCIALRTCFRKAFAARYRGEEFDFADGYWRQVMVGECGEVVEDRLGLRGYKARQVRLMMLAMLHTLIGSGDFEDMTSYRPGF